MPDNFEAFPWIELFEWVKQNINMDSITEIRIITSRSILFTCKDSSKFIVSRQGNKFEVLG